MPPSLAPSGTAAEAAVGKRRSARRSRLMFRDDAVDDVVLLRLLRAHEVVTFGVVRDLLESLPGVVGDDFVEPAPHVDDLFGVDLDVGRLALEAGRDLVD